MRVCTLSYCILLCLVQWTYLGRRLFVKENKRGVDFGVGDWDEWMEGKLWSGCIKNKI